MPPVWEPLDQDPRSRRLADQPGSETGHIDQLLLEGELSLDEYTTKLQAMQSTLSIAEDNIGEGQRSQADPG